MTLADLAARNNLHASSGPNTLWSRVNAAEALPGVSTPLTWDFWDEAGERAMRGSGHDMGVLNRREISQPTSVDDRIWALFYGRLALSVDYMRTLSDRSPGTSGDDIERNILGSVRPGVVSTPQRSRYPVIVAKVPLLLRRLPGLIEANYADTARWWRESVEMLDGTDDPSLALELWDEALRRFENVQRVHVSGSMIAQQAYGQVVRFVEKVGLPGVETSLSGGYETEDVVVLRTIWDVSRGKGTLDEFLAEHGFHGPAEGQLGTPSWREDRKPLETLLESYAGMSDEQGPEALLVRRRLERHEAEVRLLDAVRGRSRRRARGLLRKLDRWVRLRELGKATYPRTIDVARAASRILGVDLTRRGLLSQPEDVFFLLRSELDGSVDDLRARVSERRAAYIHYTEIEVPVTWVGAPEQAEREAPDLAADVAGIGVSPGRVEGRVKVIVDPDGEIPLEPGEVLVCHTTDPSWVALMLVASALVVDVGGPMSHGAIIARELGIPCVINTVNGSRALANGALVVVDGTEGTVQRVDG